jgi:hypothetical protein
MMMSPSKMMGSVANFLEIQDQPVIDAADRRLIITVVLVRWADPSTDEGR